MLASFGGAGGLHAADLARRLGVPRVLISPLAATLSAFGMLAADVVRDYAQTVMLPGDTPPAEVQAHFAPLIARGQHEVRVEGIAPQDVIVEALLDMRYHGQSYELVVPFTPGFIAHFHAAHQHAYGYACLDAPIEIVNVRVRVIGRVVTPRIRALPSAGKDSSPALLEWRAVTLGATCVVPFYRGEALQPGNVIAGPAVVVRSDTTILIGTEDQAEVDGYQNLIIDVAMGRGIQHD
jgi:N-methylhydantoinase A